MSANSFGRHFKITSFGESHGTALGVVIEGCPSGVRFDHDVLMHWLGRRKPGGENVSSRNEIDQPEILSGIFENRTLGTPIAVTVRNHDARSKDYEPIVAQPRAGHADDVWREKFDHVDHRGGGRSSGRETLARVIGGAFAQMFLSQTHPELNVWGFLRQIGPLRISENDIVRGENQFNISHAKKIEIEAMLAQLKLEGDSVGGVAEIRIDNPPKNLGQPVFHKLKSDLTAAMMSIGATTGVELGDGFELAQKKGTEVHVAGNESAYGGIRGGISTGENIQLRVAFKPTSSILDVAKRGRHDPCIVLRALSVVESMALLVLADHILWARLDRANIF